MLAKITTRVVLALLILSGWILFSIYFYNEGFLNACFVAIPLLIISWICGISIALYVIGLFFPGFFDFKFWSLSSYRSLIKEGLTKKWAVCKFGKTVRVFYYLFVSFFVFAGLVSWSVLNIKYLQFQLTNYGIKTYGVVIKYDISIVDGIKKRHVSVVFPTKKGEKQKYLQIINKYKVGDTVLIKYSEKNPAVCLLIE